MLGLWDGPRARRGTAEPPCGVCGVQSVLMSMLRARPLTMGFVPLEAAPFAEAVRPPRKYAHA